MYLSKLGFGFSLLVLFSFGLLGCEKEENNDEKETQASPEELCEEIFASRIQIPIFEKRGKKNEKAFHEYCIKQPIDYLGCETKDLFSMSEEEAENCGKLLNEHQEKSQVDR